MSLKKIIATLTNYFLIVFVFLTVLPVKLNYSSIVVFVLVGLSFIKLFCFKDNALVVTKYYLLIISTPLIVYFFGLINTLNMDYGYNFLAKNLSFIAFPFIFFAIGKHVQIRNVYKAYLIGLCLTDLFLMYLFFYNYNFGTKFYMIVTIDIYHATYLGMYNLFAFWICINYWLKKREYLLSFGALFFVVSAVMTSSRTIFILAFFSLIITFFMIFNSGVKRIVSLILILIVGVLAVASIPSIQQKFDQFSEISKLEFDNDNYQSISSRFGKIVAAVSVISDNLWIGTGTGDIKDVLVEKYQEMRFVMGYKYRYNPHNQFLDNLARNGLIGGGICILSIYCFPMLIGIRQKNLLLVSLILICFGVSLTESILDIHKGITFYVFFVSLNMNRIIQKNLNS